MISGSDVVDGELMCSSAFSCSVKDGPESLRSLVALKESVLKLDMEFAPDARELGGPQLKLEVREKIDSLGGLENRDVACVDVLSRFFAVASFFFTASGIPSHFELTFGTLAGSF